MPPKQRQIGLYGPKRNSALNESTPRPETQSKLAAFAASKSRRQGRGDAPAIRYL